MKTFWAIAWWLLVILWITVCIFDNGRTDTGIWIALIAAHVTAASALTNLAMRE